MTEKDSGGRRVRNEKEEGVLTVSGSVGWLVGGSVGRSAPYSLQHVLLLLSLLVVVVVVVNVARTGRKRADCYGCKRSRVVGVVLVVVDGVLAVVGVSEEGWLRGCGGVRRWIAGCNWCGCEWSGVGLW